jgi:hypothetical protein
MFIKKYLDFISESYNDFDSIGQWIESLAGDPQVMRIVNRYITDETGIYLGSDISPTIKLSNAVNLLHDRAKSEIKSQIDHYLEHGIEEKNPEIMASTQTGDLLENLLQDSKIVKAGRGVFQSFLKTWTALGLKDENPNWSQTPADMLICWQSPEMAYLEVSQVFSRFRSLTGYLSQPQIGSSVVKLYFGVSCDGRLEYGIILEQRVVIGDFKLNKSTLNWINKLGLKSSNSLRQALGGFDYFDLKCLGSIKNDMAQFIPGYFESKSNPTISDKKIISFGWYGVGKWDNGKLDEGELENIKQNFVRWLMTKKWSDKVLISLKSNSFWVYIYIKLKD